MDFKRYLEVNAQKIDQELDLILSDFLNEIKKINIKLLPFALGLIKACQGGKRIRGALVKLGYEIATGPSDPRNDIIRIGAALEILHTGILIHDDIIDQSPIRRGQPSLYQALGGNHYGMSQAISLGDIGLYLPLNLISEANFLGEYRLKAINHVTETIINTAWGQILDVELPVKKGKRLAEDSKFINLFKTAKYTIAGPLKLGAILAGADDRLVNQLAEFGESLGIAFQIKDDILDREITSADAETTALAYVAKAKKLIPKLTKDPKMSTLMMHLADYLVERKK